MKLGRIFLNSLLEARVHAITDSFFSEFNKALNRSPDIKQSVISVKKDIKEKEAKATYSVKDTVRVNPRLWDTESLPDELEEAQISAAEKFVEAVLSRLNINDPVDIKYSKDDTQRAKLYYKLPIFKKESSINKNSNNSINKIIEIIFLNSKDNKISGYVGIEVVFPPRGSATIDVISEATFVQYNPDKNTEHILWTPKTGPEGRQIYSPNQYRKGVKSTTKERKLGSEDDIKNIKASAKQDLLDKIKKDPKAYINKKTGKAPEPGKLPRGGFPGGVRKYVPTEVDPTLKKGSDTKSLRGKKVDVKSKTEEISYYWYDAAEIAGLTEPLKTKEENNEKFIKDRARKLIEELIDVGVDEDVIEEKNMNKVEIVILPDDEDSDYRDIKAKYDRYITASFSIDKKDYTVDPDSVSITMNGIEVLTSEY